MVELLSRWREGLQKTSRSAFGRLSGVLGASEINSGVWEGLEGLLIQADIGPAITSEVIQSLKAAARDEGWTRAEELRGALRANLGTRLVAAPPPVWTGQPMVILVVGANGSGKTTTIAKLAHHFVQQGKSVLLGAADTFRAAAADQLRIWGDRMELPVIAGAADSDPGAAAFSAVQAGRARDVDVVLIDTAGRLHTRLNLMEELKKIHRVVGKALPGAPQAVWLVLDATVGQNALQQAKAFTDAVHVTGVILAKLDTSARGGMAFAVHQALGLPILYAGLGEGIDDLEPFDPDAFVASILEKT